jgi:hypothetical protein
MSVIYAISSGSYSDYRVLAVFSSKKVAQETLRRWNGTNDSWSSGQVEEFPFYDAVPEPETVFSMIQELWDDGTEGRLNERAHTDMPFDRLFDVPPKGRPSVRFVRAPVHQGKGGRLEVRGTDIKKVQKAFRDRKAQWQATAAGVA